MISDEQPRSEQDDETVNCEEEKRKLIAESGVRRECFGSEQYRPPEWADELRGSNSDFTPMSLTTTDEPLGISDVEEYRRCEE